MNTTKIAVISIIVIGILTAATLCIAGLKPQMHKTIMLESIIYKRSK